MRFIGLAKADEKYEAGEPPSPELFERMGPFLEEATKAGVLVGGDGLQPSSKGKRVRLQNGKVTVTDGPFAETKELIASYAILECKTMDEAVYWTQRFVEVGGEGECEFRPIMRPEDFGKVGD